MTYPSPTPLSNIPEASVPRTGTPKYKWDDPPGISVSRKGPSHAHFLWRPQPDLNRCCRRERPVSWTWLDDGD